MGCMGSQRKGRTVNIPYGEWLEAQRYVQLTNYKYHYERYEIYVDARGVYRIGQVL